VRTAARRRIARPLISSLEAPMHSKVLHVDAIRTEAEVPRDSQQHEHLVGEGKREARRYRVGRKIRYLVDNVWAAGTPGRIADLRGNSRRDNAAFQNRLDWYGD
jgi:hypothetical protein